MHWGLNREPHYELTGIQVNKIWFMKNFNCVHVLETYICYDLFY